MNQLTLETFLVPESEQENAPAKFVLVLILEDFNVAWIDRNWYLHFQVLVYLREKMATIFVSRRIAFKGDALRGKKSHTGDGFIENIRTAISIPKSKGCDRALKIMNKMLEKLQSTA